MNLWGRKNNQPARGSTLSFRGKHISFSSEEDQRTFLIDLNDLNVLHFMFQESQTADDWRSREDAEEEEQKEGQKR